MSIEQHDQGFTLLEVLISLVILALGLLALAGMQMVSFQGNHSSFLRSQASFCANDILDRMRVNRQEAFDGDYDISLNATVSGTPSTTAEADLIAWKSALGSMLPQGAGSVAVDDGFATILIRWQDPVEGGAVTQFQTESEI